MVLPDLSQLPAWAVVLFAVSLAVIVGLAWLGERIGRRAPPPPNEGAGRILGAVIDSKKADELIAAFGRLSTRLAENTRALDANTAAVSSAEREIDEARTDIRELNREIAKSGK